MYLSESLNVPLKDIDVFIGEEGIISVTERFDSRLGLRENKDPWGETNFGDSTILGDSFIL